jgi:hypothetical protein
MYTSSVQYGKPSTDMKATFLDLRKRSKDIVRALDQNQSVTLFYRGKAKGVIVPASRSAGESASVRKHRAFGMWKDRTDMKDVRAVMVKLRKTRHDL